MVFAPVHVPSLSPISSPATSINIYEAGPTPKIQNTQVLYQSALLYNTIIMIHNKILGNMFQLFQEPPL